MKILNEKALIRYASSGGPADKDGYMQKKGELNKGYQKRWFVLKGNLLFYYERKGDREPIGVVVLEGCTIELAEDCLDNFTFQIKFQGSSSRTYILSAASQEVMESWMKSLSVAGYEYVKLMVGELQQKLVEVNSEEQRRVLEEAKRQSMILSQTYIERKGLDQKGNRSGVVFESKRKNPFNQRRSESEFETCDLFNVMESGAPGPYSPRESWAQKTPRTFSEMHRDIGLQVARCQENWMKRKAAGETSKGSEKLLDPLS